VNDNPSALTESSGTYVLCLCGRDFSGKNEENQALNLRTVGVCFEPQDGRALLIAETKRTPNGVQKGDLSLLLRQFCLPDYSGQF